MSATDIAIQKNIYGSGKTALIISKEEMEDIMKIVKSLEESGLLIKGIIKSNGLVNKVLDSQSRGPMFKIAGWLQHRLSLSSFRGQSNECHEFLET